MGTARFETLNPQTQDLVDCLIPGIVSNWNLGDILDAIPEDIRMRKWDCAKRDHIINESENDARNWGVSFLKDLLTISRLLKGQVETFQNDLRQQLTKSKSSHPWIRLKDIQTLKKQYDGSGNAGDSDSEAVVDSPGASSSEGTTTEDELNAIRKKRGRPLKESKSKRKTNKRRKATSPPPRLRRSSDLMWERRDRSHRHGRDRHSDAYYTQDERWYPQDREDSHMVAPGSAMQRYPSSSISGASFATQDNGCASRYDFNNLSTHKLQLQLEVAEAELKAKRLRLAIIAAQQDASTAGAADLDGEGTQAEPHIVNDD